MDSQGTIDGYDWKTSFGAIITGGIPSFLAFPKRKDSVQHDWPEVDGIDIDLSAPTFEARQFTLSITMDATGRDDFKTKYYGLFTVLKQLGSRTLYFADIDLEFTCFFVEQQNVKKNIRKMNGPKVSVSFDLIFKETDPADNIDDVYIITENDEFIIA